MALKIWNSLDLADFPQLHASYYRSAKGVVLAYSVTDKKSFEQVLVWAATAKKEASGAKVLLVGTKCDLKRERDLLKGRYQHKRGVFAANSANHQQARPNSSQNDGRAFVTKN